MVHLSRLLCCPLFTPLGFEAQSLVQWSYCRFTIPLPSQALQSFISQRISLRDQTCLCCATSLATTHTKSQNHPPKNVLCTICPSKYRNVLRGDWENFRGQRKKPLDCLVGTLQWSGSSESLRRQEPPPVRRSSSSDGATSWRTWRRRRERTRLLAVAGQVQLRKEALQLEDHDILLHEEGRTKEIACEKCGLLFAAWPVPLR